MPSARSSATERWAKSRHTPWRARSVRTAPSVGRDEPETYASLVAFVALGKVLSPQFLIWLIPLVVLVRRPSAIILFVAALVLTQAWFPQQYWDYALHFDEAVSWLVLARDLVLVGLLVVLVRPLLPTREAADARGRQPVSSSPV